MADSGEASRLEGSRLPAALNRFGHSSRRLALALAVAAGLTQAATAQTASEYQIKAAYLYNFAKATQWSREALPNADSPLVIAVFGGDDDVFKVVRNTLTGKSIHGHPLEIRHSRTVAELKSCQVVFFRGSEKNGAAAIAALNGTGIMLVGEDANFLSQGGMINLSLNDGRVTFEVNPASIERGGVRYGDTSLPPQKDADSTVESAGSRSLKNLVSPAYPNIARNMSLKGTVQLQALVRADGTVKEVHVVGGHPMLAAAAEEAVMKWRYEPAGKETLESVKISFGRN